MSCKNSISLTNDDVHYNFEKLKEAAIIEYEEVWTRISILEDKVAKFLTTLSIVFIAYIYLITSEITWTILEKSTIHLQSILVFLFILYLLITSSTIISCLDAFELNEFKRIKSLQNYIELAKNEHSTQLNWELFYNYDDARIHNEQILIIKTNHIQNALKSLKLSTLILFMLVFILFLSYIGEKL